MTAADPTDLASYTSRELERLYKSVRTRAQAETDPVVKQALEELCTKIQNQIELEMDVDEAKAQRKSPPQFRHGEHIDITGGMDSAEWIRKMRDGE